MRIPGWFFFTVGVALHLLMLLLAHFKGTAFGFVVFPLPLSIIGLWLLRLPDSGTKLDENAKTLLLLWTDSRIVGECMLIRDSLGALAEDSMIGAEVRQCIEKLLRPHMQDVARALADHPELMENVHVELQMALGDCQVRVERVWTAIADGASAEAHASLLLAHTAAIRMCMIAERKAP